jgi:hypothetical protein
LRRNCTGMRLTAASKQFERGWLWLNFMEYITTKAAIVLRDHCTGVAFENEENAQTDCGYRAVGYAGGDCPTVGHPEKARCGTEAHGRGKLGEKGFYHARRRQISFGQEWGKQRSSAFPRFEKKVRANIKRESKSGNASRRKTTRAKAKISR